MSADLLALESPALRPLADGPREWTRWLGPVFSLALLAGVLREFPRLELRADSHLFDAGTAFWVLFIVYYLATPLWEWLIYRRLWQLPADGILALLRKEITNELLLGYLGEVYFYGWARQRARLTTAPFGAIKDVTILSAAAGNVVTLCLLPLGVALIDSLPPGIDPLALKLSVSAFLVTTLAPLVFRRRLFSLPRRALAEVALFHAGRVTFTIGLYAALWHMLLPQVAIGWWIALAALRQLVGRLPLAPSKDVLFAAIAGFFVGRNSEVAALLALLGTVTMLFHIVLGLIFGATGMFEKEPR